MQGIVKRGLSDIITTVMLISLTVVVVGIVWVAVMPMIRDRMGSSDYCMNADVSVETAQGYTCWDSVQKIIVVQVRTGSVNVNVSGFKFYVSSGGNSVYYPKESYALPNSYNVFYLNSTGISSIDKLGVAAVVRNGKITKDCLAVFVNGLKSCDAGNVPPSQVLNASS